jgi:hypothetical protein
VAPVIRKERPADRDRVRELLPGIAENRHALHVIVADARGTTKGAATLLLPDAGDTVHMGAVATDPPNWRLAQDLVAACIDESLARGFTKGDMEIHDRRLLERITEQFKGDVQDIGYNQLTGEVGYWLFVIDLADAQRQMKQRPPA